MGLSPAACSRRSPPTVAPKLILAEPITTQATSVRTPFPLAVTPRHPPRHLHMQLRTTPIPKFLCLCSVACRRTGNSCCRGNIVTLQQPLPPSPAVPHTGGSRVSPICTTPIPTACHNSTAATQKHPSQRGKQRLIAVRDRSFQWRQETCPAPPYTTCNTRGGRTGVTVGPTWFQHIQQRPTRFPCATQPALPFGTPRPLCSPGRGAQSAAHQHARARMARPGLLCD